MAPYLLFMARGQESVSLATSLTMHRSGRLAVSHPFVLHVFIRVKLADRAWHRIALPEPLVVPEPAHAGSWRGAVMCLIVSPATAACRIAGLVEHRRRWVVRAQPFSSRPRRHHRPTADASLQTILNATWHTS